ncbi:MAG: hypothetical protein ACUZ8N_06240 [Candidatus Scalindua sp.]
MFKVANGYGRKLIVNGLSWKGDGEALTLAKGGFAIASPDKNRRGL